MLILSACGGSAEPKARPSSWQTVNGAGFRFEAPKDWKAQHERGVARAARGKELVQVATFPLAKPYSSALFRKVDRELRVRIQGVAHELAGTPGGERTVTAAGIRSHAYDVTAGTATYEYTFVLRGKREYLLLCKRESGDRSFCERLVTSFAL